MVKLRMTSNLLSKWTSHVSKSSNSRGKLPGPNSDLQYNSSAKRWIHEDNVLINSRVLYSVKFLGHVEVDYPKGLDIVRESIKKLEFQEHLRRSQGQKIRTVELAISIDGIALRDPKTKIATNEFPLHRISYCADDKSERKYLSFITKIEEGSIRHECFVFVSDKLSEEITLTIGQAFDLAYKKFLDSSGNDIDAKRELIHAKRKINELERKVMELERRLQTRERCNSTITSANNIQTNTLTNNTRNPKSQPVIDLTLTTKKLATSMNQNQSSLVEII